MHIENVYFTNLKKSGFFVEKEKAVPIVFEEIKLDCGYRIDLLIENKLVVETKSVESLKNIYTAQTLTH